MRLECALLPSLWQNCNTFTEALLEKGQAAVILDLRPRYGGTWLLKHLLRFHNKLLQLKKTRKQRVRTNFQINKDYKKCIENPSFLAIKFAV